MNVEHISTNEIKNILVNTFGLKNYIVSVGGLKGLGFAPHFESKTGSYWNKADADEMFKKASKVVAATRAAQIEAISNVLNSSTFDAREVLREERPRLLNQGVRALLARAKIKGVLVSPRKTLINTEQVAKFRKFLQQLPTRGAQANPAGDLFNAPAVDYLALSKKMARIENMLETVLTQLGVSFDQPH